MHSLFIALVNPNKLKLFAEDIKNFSLNMINFLRYCSAFIAAEAFVRK